MNENENSFESLRRLLAFKNRETPPPGYFDSFSSNVLGRIRAGESSAPEGFSAGASWLVKVLQAFEFKPAFAGTFALGLCMVLVFGIVYAERPDAVSQSLLTQSAQITAPTAMTGTPDFTQQAETSGLIATTNPVLNLDSVATLFNQPNQLAQQVSFTVPGN
jgi:hypothetical protein